MVSSNCLFVLYLDRPKCYKDIVRTNLMYGLKDIILTYLGKDIFQRKDKLRGDIFFVYFRKEIRLLQTFVTFNIFNRKQESFSFHKKYFYFVHRSIMKKGIWIRKKKLFKFNKLPKSNFFFQFNKVIPNGKIAWGSFISHFTETWKTNTIFSLHNCNCTLCK